MSMGNGQLKLLSITSLNALVIFMLVSDASIYTLLSNGAEAKLKFI